MAMHRQAPRCFSAGPTGSTAGDGLRAELLLDDERLLHQFFAAGVVVDGG